MRPGFVVVLVVGGRDIQHVETSIYIYVYFTRLVGFGNFMYIIFVFFFWGEGWEGEGLNCV